MLLRRHLFRACFVINSGSSLEEIDASELFPDGSWDRIQLAIQAEYDRRVDAGQEIVGPKQFQQVMLGNSPKLRQEALRHICRKVLFILGARDEVFNVGEVMRLGAKRTGIAMFQVPSVGHRITTERASKTEWDKWRDFLARLIVSFERDHPSDSLVEESLELTISEIVLPGDKERIRARLLLWDSSCDELVPVAVTSNIDETWEAQLRLPKGVGLANKVFESCRKGTEKAFFEKADFSNLEQGDHGYGPEDAQRLRGLPIGLVYAFPVFAPDRANGDSECIGALAFASDRPASESVLANKKTETMMRLCSVLVTAAMSEEGGAARVLERTAERERLY